MTHDRDDNYLWDRTGDPDRELVRLERVLGPLGHAGRLDHLPPRESAHDAMGSDVRGKRLVYALSAFAAAAVLVIIASAAWFTLVQPRIGWAVQSVSGQPQLDGQVFGARSRLGVGRWLTTDANSRARLAVGQIGRVEVDPNTRLQLVEARGREHRMALAEGTIHARIWAPPKFFFVNTPAATAIDLGCAYTLHVNPDGSGLLRVVHGWVGFEHAGRESFIPEQAVCATRQGTGPGTPRYEDAPDGYADALNLLDFGPADDLRRSAALDVVLSRARTRDALTLWHLLQRGSLEDRSRVYERMAIVAPPPSIATRDAVLRGDRQAIDAWWNHLGLDSTIWWRIWTRRW